MMRATIALWLLLLAGCRYDREGCYGQAVAIEHDPSCTGHGKFN